MYSEYPAFSDDLSFEQTTLFPSIIMLSSNTTRNLHKRIKISGNIIAVEKNQEYPNGFYLIDPNTENYFSSYFLDYAKLLQSLHGGYEFLVNTPSVKISGNRMQFIMNRSVSYDELYEKYRAYLF